jgi:hypothetical protein
MKVCWSGKQKSPDSTFDKPITFHKRVRVFVRSVALILLLFLLVTGSGCAVGFKPLAAALMFIDNGPPDPTSHPTPERVDQPTVLGS